MVGLKKGEKKENRAKMSTVMAMFFVIQRKAFYTHVVSVCLWCPILRDCAPVQSGGNKS